VQDAEPVQRVAARVDGVEGGGADGQSLQLLAAPQSRPEEQSAGGHMLLPIRLRCGGDQDALQVGGSGGGAGDAGIALRPGRRIHATLDRQQEFGHLLALQLLHQGIELLAYPFHILHLVLWLMGGGDWNRGCGSTGRGLRGAATAIPKHGRKAGGTQHPAVHLLNLNRIPFPLPTPLLIASVDQHIVAGVCATAARSGTAAVGC